MFERKKVVLQADLAETNVQLRRIADSLERYLSDVHGISLHATTDDMSKAELERVDGLSEVEQEFYAAIEQLEADGVPPNLLAGAYKRLGLEPPTREDEPTAREMSRAQPGTAEAAGDVDEPTTARRDEEGE